MSKANKIYVYQIMIEISLHKEIRFDEVQNALANFIDGALCRNAEFVETYKSQGCQYYVFDSLYPIARLGVYEADKWYTLTIRTMKKEIYDIVLSYLAGSDNHVFKAGKVKDKRTLPKKKIHKLYSITPCVMKSDEKYSARNITDKQFQQTIKMNLIKKYNDLMNTNIEENFKLFTSFEKKNSGPISVKYNTMRLSGDKISGEIADNPMAQTLAYMALGTGILENNFRGMGFVNNDGKC